MNALKLRGEYRVEVLNAQREVVRDTGWFPNLITNTGLDLLGSGSTLGNYCRIGTGATAPTNSDSSLVAQVASTSGATSTSIVNNGSPNYETAFAITYEFAQGSVVGNMAELGVGSGASGSTLFSRALILDGGGMPATISVLSTEILHVTYRLTVYPTLTDSTGTVVIGGVTYSYTARAANAAQGLNIDPRSASITNVGPATAYAGDIGAITAQPSGAATGLSGSLLSYGAGSYYRDFQVNAPISGGNLTGGIKSLYLGLGNGNGNGTMTFTQVSFTPPIPKDNTKQLSIVLRQPFGRY